MSCFGYVGCCPPTLDDYGKQVTIAEKDRCRQCKGLGKVRWRMSSGYSDYKYCYECRGTGVQPKWRLSKMDETWLLQHPIHGEIRCTSWQEAWVLLEDIYDV